MNPLIHATFTDNLLHSAGISIKQPEVLIGSVVPDLSILGVIPEKDAHLRSIEFLDYLSHTEPSLVPFGTGFVLHGECPHCLDYYTHSPRGYIDQKKPDVLSLAHQNKITFQGIDPALLSHILTEFACDSLAEQSIAQKLHLAFKQARIPLIAFHMARFFKGDYQRILKLLNHFKHFNFNKLRTFHGIAHTIQDFMIYQKFANKGILNSYKYLWVRVNPFKTHKLIQLIKDVRVVVKQDCHEFLDTAQNKVYKTVVRKQLEPYL